jgi:hypothetical protein
MSNPVMTDPAIEICLVNVDGSLEEVENQVADFHVNGIENGLVRLLELVDAMGVLVNVGSHVVEQALEFP